MSELGHVWLVGAGPGDPALITVAGMNALRRAEVVVYDRLAPASLLDEAPAEAERVDAGKSAGDHTLSQDDINRLLVERGLAGRRVVRLKGGDPYVFGRGGEEAMALARAGVPCTVIPGVTSAIGGLAAGGVPVTHRGVATSFVVVTGHEDPTKPEAGVRWDRLARSADTLVVLMGVERLEGITRAIVAGGRAAETPAAVVQAASTPEQRTVTGTLATIAQVARQAGIAAPALFVVGEVAGLQARLDPRSLAPLAGRRVLVTRSRSQASTLVDALRLEGAVPVVLPAIEVERRIDPGALDGTCLLLEQHAYGWVAFTSANAVDVFMDALMERGRDARLFNRTRICAIGAATDRALRARGLIADAVPGEAIGDAVPDAIAERSGCTLQDQRVLLPRAEGARSAIIQGLRARGAEVDELTLYLAAPPASAPPEAIALIKSGGIDCATFTSSSTVRNLATLLGGDLSPLADAVVACIGPETAGTASEHGLTPQVVATVHTVDGLVSALRSYVHSARTKEVG